MIAVPATAKTPTPAAAAPTAQAPAAKAQTSFRVASIRRNLVAGKRVLAVGTLRGAGSGKNVALQTRRGSGAWTTVARDVTGKGGAYRLRYTPKTIGSYTTRVTFAGDKATRSARRDSGRVNVYRKVLVSWYGGGAGACGNSGSATYGVAHKTLPCGTKVRLRYKNRSVTATVVDRGPYIGGREYDLTPPTKQALGAGDLTTVMATR